MTSIFAIPAPVVATTSWTRYALALPVLVTALVATIPTATAQITPSRPAEAAMDTTFVEPPEALLEPLTEEAVSGDPTELLELIEELLENPLDINTAGAGEFALVPAFTPRIAEAIVRYRETAGAFGSIPEIQLVDGVGPDVFLAARPYLTIGEPFEGVGVRPSPYPRVPTLAEVRQHARVDVLQRMQRRLELARGYQPVPENLAGTPDEPRRYLGSPERIYTRVRATFRRNLSANLTMEKDPGEPFVWDPENAFYGYDFVSFHLSALRLGRLDALVVGDFVAEFGQGVALWRAAGFGKGRETIRPLVKRGRGIRPYGSTDENRFFRGLATTIALTPDVYVSAFASRRFLDARINQVDTTRADSDLEGLTVAGMPVTGLHRTPTEIAQKNALGQSLVGSAVELRLRRAIFGAVAYRSTFDTPLVAGPQPYQRFQFEGDEAAMGSVFGSGFLGEYHVFGEIARDPGGTIGGVGGIEGELGPLDALVLVRHYPRDFTSLHGYAFGERNGVTQNETGVYLGLRLRPSREWTFSGFFDQFHFPWVRIGVPRPSSGHEALLFAEYRPMRWLNVYAQARSKTRETGAEFGAPAGALLPGLEPETRQTLRLQGEYVASRQLRMRARVEGSRYVRADRPSETGALLFHDLRWQPRSGILIDARLTFFDTDTFNARLFQFENDLFGVLTNTMLSGRGTRAYAVVSYRPSGMFDGLDLRVKLASTRYQDRHVVGTGLDQIEANRVRDLGVQVRYRF
jgi:hypothetical protein